MAVYVDGLLKAVVGPATAPAATLTLQPLDLPTSMPCTVVKHFSGSGSADPRFNSTRAVVQVDAYHAEKRAAFDLCNDAVNALVQAWRTQTVTPDGWIADIESASDPAELRLPDQASGFTRYQATLRITARA